MSKNSLGERMARVETNVSYLREGHSNIYDKIGDIHVALLGDGKSNNGIISRVKTLEDYKSTKNYITNKLINILAVTGTCLGAVGTYLAIFKP